MTMLFAATPKDHGTVLVIKVTKGMEFIVKVLVLILSAYFHIVKYRTK